MALIDAFRRGSIGRITRIDFSKKFGEVNFEFSIYANEYEVDPYQKLQYSVKDKTKWIESLSFMNVKSLQKIIPEEEMLIHLDINFGNDDYSTDKDYTFFRNKYIKYLNGAWHNYGPPAQVIHGEGVFTLDGETFVKVCDLDDIMEFNKFFGLDTQNQADFNIIKCAYMYLKSLPEWSNAKDYQ
jgi:hypothetical protein